MAIIIYLQPVEGCVAEGIEEGGSEQAAGHGIEGTQEARGWGAAKDVHVELFQEVDGEGVSLREPAQSKQHREEED